MTDIWEGFDFPTLDSEDNHYTANNKPEEELSDVEFMDAIIRSNIGLNYFNDDNSGDNNLKASSEVYTEKSLDKVTKFSDNNSEEAFFQDDTNAHQSGLVLPEPDEIDWDDFPILND